MIREAEPRDLERLVQMGRAFFHEAGWDDVSRWDDAGARDALGRMMGRDDCVMLVADVQGFVVGMAAAVICPTWFCPDEKTAQEWFWYVDPPARCGVGGPLLAALETAVRDRGASSFTMLAVASLRAETLDRLYRRRGYRPAERTYIKRL
ncbi:GNAT family N-acetyltransferase [Zavarzinia compransoris]|uniref:GNAT family N-acetyltransferase n=1 Tax=Zavarzinia marina TaxID=2911065 RepID=UPI001F270243|nr:GNAT family N-acetyltransferase [Zavarzinia marina]MCF4166331.1 GNAT family N-acetyltransferase [Zavarzinia marina]